MLQEVQRKRGTEGGKKEKNYFILKKVTLFVQVARLNKAKKI